VASIEPRDRNGKRSYRVRYRDPGGRERSKSFGRKADAQAFVISTEHAKRAGSYVDPAAGRVPLGEWAERWYASTAALRPSTRLSYRAMLDRHVLPRFAGVPLARIDRLAVREWAAGLVGAGLSVKTAGLALLVLRRVLAAAVEGELLARNVAAGVKLPKAQKYEALFLTAVEVETLASAIDPRYGTLIRFAAWTGLRPSELAALRVRRLDLLRGTVRVAEAAVDVKGNGRLVWGPVKTSTARTVRLPRFLCEDLAAYLAGRPHDRDALVFTMPKGGPIYPSQFAQRHYKPAVRAAGLPDALRLYDLRHTAASLLIREGASIKAVQAQLGHATAAITLDVYAHLLPDELEHLADRMDRAHDVAVEAATRLGRGPAGIGSTPPRPTPGTGATGRHGTRAARAAGAASGTTSSAGAGAGRRPRRR
jgi:integrase